MLRLILSFVLFPLSVQAEDITANYGDKLDANPVPAELERRTEEGRNLPDITDENQMPAASEERQREEVIEPVEPNNDYEILDEEDLRQNP